MKIRKLLIFMGILLVFSPGQLSAYQKKLLVKSFKNIEGWKRNYDAGKIIADLIAISLRESNRFKLAEREMIMKDDLMPAGIDSEMNSKMNNGSEKMNSNINMKSGKGKTSYQFVITGRVLIFEPAEKQDETNVTADSENKKETAEVEIELSLINAVTGQTAGSKKFKSLSSKGQYSADLSGDELAFNNGTLEKSKIGKALKMSVSDSVQFIKDTLDKLPFEAMIISVDDENEEVVLNVGETQGVQFKDQFYVFKVGPGFTDPVSSRTLGQKEELIGVIRIKTVLDHYSLAQIMAGEGFESEQIIRPYKGERRQNETDFHWRDFHPGNRKK